MPSEYPELKVNRCYDEGCCDFCDNYVDTYLYEVVTKEGTLLMKLCHKCLISLLKAIVERE